MNEITSEFIRKICDLYGDDYDDREEDSSPGGADWLPGHTAGHKSLAAFRKELEEAGISLSTGKIRKILITGGVYSTKLSRAAASEYQACNGDIEKTAGQLHLSASTICQYLPYERTAYGLEGKSDNARRVERWRSRHLHD